MAKLVPSLNSRLINKEWKEEKEVQRQRYLELMEKLETLVAKDVRTKIEMTKTVFEIFEDKLYILGGFGNFTAFIKKCGLSTTSIYSYIKIGRALKEGYITEQDIIKRGINSVRVALEQGNIETLKEDKKTDKVIPLRILIPSDNAYKYFKSNTKFASYTLSRIYNEQRQLLDSFLFDFNEEKRRKRRVNLEDVIEAEEEQKLVEDVNQKSD
ncbi:chromosome replication/partitioning protein (plasmid) [Borrelia sp. A-FGy1]|uniref:chromosome replication/partitioning protein n=1 Tax=Borrelia sp. A-FGy1 TaxID=2608247 RepID=UPI0015F51542|nr:chromosome replication/partitioning protein [Borrelia sp. A-FGy1]QMU99788.1 chromosome replication/partitioning protein [Borrelia sp. A-FGy1]